MKGREAKSDGWNSDTRRTPTGPSLTSLTVTLTLSPSYVPYIHNQKQTTHCLKYDNGAFNNIFILLSLFLLLKLLLLF